MIRNRVFRTFQLFHRLSDRGLTLLFGHQFRKKYILAANSIKNQLFPERVIHNSVAVTSIVAEPAESALQNTNPPIPEWALAEMRILGREIDPAIYPNDAFIASCEYYLYPAMPNPGRIYKTLIQQCTVEHYAFCFALPWLVRGGADLVALRHIELAHKSAKGKVLVILTEPGESPWLNKIPEGIDILNVSEIVPQVSHEEILMIIARLLLQLHIDTLHIINSRHVWEVIHRHGLAVRQRTKIFVSLYSDDYDKDRLPVGYARQYLGSCYEHIEKVFSDNSVFPKLLCDTYGYPRELFKVIKNPAPAVFTGGLERPQHPTRQVLWASRLDREKRPDILLAIAKLLPDISFTVYGSTSNDVMKDAITELQTLDNVKMMGAYNGAESLPFSSHDVFLYTSQWDGMPNMILEAASTGIPVVASCVGGVSDVINEKTGFLIRDIEDASLYAKAIRCVLDNPTEAESLALAARQYVESEHTQATFESALLNTGGYFSDDALPPCEQNSSCGV
jgi:glycosyltransferase involved in cell wall biosynthesis